MSWKEKYKAATDYRNRPFQLVAPSDCLNYDIVAWQLKDRNNRPEEAVRC
jgi:hypothetical protein